MKSASISSLLHEIKKVETGVRRRTLVDTYYSLHKYNRRTMGEGYWNRKKEYTKRRTFASYSVERLIQLSG